MKWRRLLVLVLLGGIATPALLQQVLWSLRYTAPVSVIMGPESQAIYENSAIPGASAYRHIRDESDPAARFLVFRQADFGFYAERNWIRHIDPRLMQALQATDKDELLTELTSIGITNVVLPPGTPATFYNSVFKDFLGDPNYARLRPFGPGEYREFELLRVLEKRECRLIPREWEVETVRGAGFFSSSRRILADDVREDLVGGVRDGRNVAELTTYQQGILRLRGTLAGVRNLNLSIALIGVDRLDMGMPIPVWNSASVDRVHSIDVQFPVDRQVLGWKLFITSDEDLEDLSERGIQFCLYEDEETLAAGREDTNFTTCRHGVDFSLMRRRWSLVFAEMKALQCIVALDKIELSSNEPEKVEGSVPTQKYLSLAGLYEHLVRWGNGLAEGPISKTRRWIARFILDQAYGQLDEYQLHIRKCGTGELDVLGLWSDKFGAMDVVGYGDTFTMAQEELVVMSIFIPQQMSATRIAITSNLNGFFLKPEVGISEACENLLADSGLSLIIQSVSVLKLGEDGSLGN